MTLIHGAKFSNFYLVLTRVAESESVGVGDFRKESESETPHVQFLYVLVMLTAQLTRPRAPVECSTVIFLREPAAYRPTQRATHKKFTF